MSLQKIMKSEKDQIDLDEIGGGELSVETELSGEELQVRSKGAMTGGEVKAKVTVRAKGSGFEMDVKMEGEVKMTCDRCMGELTEAVNYEGVSRIVKGDEVRDEDENGVIVVAENDARIDIKEILYSDVELSLPLRHVHKPGECDAAMIAELSRYEGGGGQDETSGKQEMDPRWASLAKLTNKQ